LIVNLPTVSFHGEDLWHSNNVLFTEQEEMFMKFNQDQLRRKFDFEMSDCSCKKFAFLYSLSS